VNPDEISVDEILAEMDELGRAKFDVALGRARLKKALARIAELQAAVEGLATHDGN